MRSKNLRLSDDYIGKNETLNNKKKTMNSAKPHPFIAGLCDFYLVNVFSGALIAFVTSIIGQTFQYPFTYLIPVFCNLLALASSIIYHAVISKNVLWLSPGDIIAGKRLIDDIKVWTNQHGHNRWLEFSFTIMTLIVLGNEWDKLTVGHVFTIGEVLMKTLKVTIFYVFIILIGKGKFSKKKDEL